MAPQVFVDSLEPDGINRYGTEPYISTFGFLLRNVANYRW